MSLGYRNRSKRISGKEQGVANYLRQRIVSGEFSLGARLQPRRELEHQLNVSSVTVQRALDQLVHDGFVETRGPLGTFVSDMPPHLSRYGLVFPHRPSAERPWRRFWTALWNESMHLEQSRPMHVPVYYEAQRAHGDEASHKTLTSDVEFHRLAGLFFVAPPKSWAGEPIMTRPDLPRVVMGRDAEIPGCVSIYPDMQTFFERAVADLVARGRRRIAVLTIPHPRSWETYLYDAMSSSGLTAVPYWTQMVPPDQAEYAQNVMHIMFHPGQSERPDGLIIADDNLVEYAAAGLLAAGVKVPADLDIVAHCNHPWPTPSVMPVRRLGFDAREVMRLAIDSINEQRAGGQQRTGMKVTAVFDDELSTG
jgi:DNA-binding LacI/PurR family transcriptional regulator